MLITKVDGGETLHATSVWANGRIVSWSKDRARAAEVTTEQVARVAAFYQNRPEGRTLKVVQSEPVAA